jgi:hypothetical protein
MDEKRKLGSEILILNFICYFNVLDFSLYSKTYIMRKLIVFTFFVLSFQMIQAQNKLGLRLSAGIFSMKAYRVTPEFNYSEPGLAGTAGIHYDLPLNETFSVRPELNFSYQSSSESFSKTTQKISYIQLPVIFAAHIANAPLIVYGGPQLGFLTGASRLVNSVKQDTKASFTKTDFGFTYGLSTKTFDNHLYYDFRIYSGITNLYKAEYDLGAQTRPTMITIGVGYRF